MSRLVRKPIIIPEKVKIEYKDSMFDVTGPLGKLLLKTDPRIKLKIEKEKIFVISDNDERQDSMLKGLTWALIRNTFIGVTKGFNKQLEIRGVGYQARLSGDKLVLQVRFSHPVEYKIPDGIKVDIGPKGTLITVSGIDKQLVGEVAAQIRRIYPPEPYKGTGIRYVDEKVIKKAGKTAIGIGVGAAATGIKK